MHSCRTLLLFFLVLTAAEAQWPGFRGPNGSGVDGAAGYPVEFSPSKNVVWKVSVPYGQSSPVIMGNRVYLTASTKEKLLKVCLHARTGVELWRREIRRERAQEIFRANDAASPTPAADQSGVFVVTRSPSTTSAPRSTRSSRSKDRWQRRSSRQ